MKKTRAITWILFLIYLILLTWIILLKTQFSFSALGHYRSLNLNPFHASVITNGSVSLDEILITACLSFLLGFIWGA